MNEAETGSSATEVHVARQQVRSASLRWHEIDLPRIESMTNSGLFADTSTLKLIASAVRELTPRHVIELGCGATTELLAQLAFEHGRMAVTTFEHDPWAAAELLASAGANAINYRWFSFCICPLVSRRCGATLYPVYDDGMTVPTVPYPADLVVINGPPQVLGGRGGTMYQALKYARSGTVVLLLNVRSEEENTVERWVRELEAHLTFVPPGLMQRHLAFVVREPRHVPFSLSEPAAQMRVCTEQERAAMHPTGTT